MVDLTLSKLTNKQLIESAFKQIEKETGFHILNKEFGNFYFLFEDEEDSICHFYIKEIPGFKFAFWNTCRYDSIKNLVKDNKILWSDSLHISSKSELIFFTQYERDIDKFKPARSGFVNGIFRTVYENDEGRVEEWIMYDLIDILKYMHKHPIKSIVYSGCETKFIWDELSGPKAFRIYVNDSYSYYKYKFLQWLKTKKAIFIAKKLAKKLNYVNVFIINRGDCWSPKIEIFVRRKTNSALDQVDNDYDIIDNYLNKYYMLLSVTCMDIDFSVDTTKEDLQKDKDLKELFWKHVKELKDDVFFTEENVDKGAGLVYMKVDNENES